MVEIGKRSHQHSDRDNEGSNQKKRQVKKESSTDSELVVYRILCPDDVIGSVIGKNGKVINSIRQETRAWIKIVDPFPCADKRVITIYCHVKNKDMDVDADDVTEPLCPAQDALLKVHDAIVNVLAYNNDNKKEEVSILVPTSQAANIIGKSGATIRRLRSTSKANIKITPKDSNDITHSCAMSFDNFVQISGDAEVVKKALYAVSTILYKFPPKEEISLETSVPELTPRVIIPSDVPIYAASSFYPGADAIVTPRSGLPVIGTTPNVPELSGFADAANALPVYTSALPVIPGYNGPSRSGELVVRVLCPSDKIGLVIGKGGGTIKSMRQTSGAHIDVDDKKDGREECLITITSTEATGDVKSASVEAVLLLQEKINNEDEERVNIRLLVTNNVIGCLIGKGGSVVNDMRKKTKADIRISKGEKPRWALFSDELVEVFGEVINLRDALLQIVLRLREFVLRDKDGQSTPNDDNQAAPSLDHPYASNLSLPTLLPSAPPLAPLSYDKKAEAERRLGMFPGSSLYGYSSLQAGEDGYGQLSSSYSSKTYGGRSPYVEMAVEMAIPASALAKVVGKGGTNLENIRKISGAHVEIVDSKTSHFERIAQISGTPEQKQSAENLIKAFILST